MWRWSIGFLFWAVWYSQLSHAGKVWCFQTIQDLGATVECPGLGSPTGYCVQGASTFGSSVTQAVPSTYTGMLSFQFGTTGAVDVGLACGASTGFVVMNVGDYDAMIQAGSVVSKLQEGYELGIVALAVLGLVLGLFAGYKVVQRRDSQ